MLKKSDFNPHLKQFFSLPVLSFICNLFVLFRVVGLWRNSLSKKNAKAAQSLADPTEYENLFPGLTDAFKTEQFLAAQRHQPILAKRYSSVQVSVTIIC